ncbi:MAG: sulfotransferase [Bacteroidetes bacterium]|nr:sulfotransferase [Bacteroidota bacterium]
MNSIKDKKEQKSPIFIVGNSRSGTTMMARIIGNHPDIFTFNEIHFFEQLWSGYKDREYLSKNESIKLMSRLIHIQREGYYTKINVNKYWVEAADCIESLIIDQLLPLKIYEGFLNNETQLNGKIIPCEHTPRNVFYISEIIDSFPEVRIINMIRDPRDVLISQKNKWKRRYLGDRNTPLYESIRSWINYHPITISKLWNSSINAVKKMEDCDNILSMKYEDFVSNPVKILKRICDHLSISYHNNMLNVSYVGSSHSKDSENVFGIQNNIEKWKRSSDLFSDIFICQRITQRNLAYCNYKEEQIIFNLFSVVLKYLTFPLKGLLAFLFNLNRMNNILGTLRKRLQ